MDSLIHELPEFCSYVSRQKRDREKNEELQECSIRDVLTGLFNRRRINNVLAEVHAQADRYGADFSVIILDIDHFKIINDTHGHQIGDRYSRKFHQFCRKIFAMSTPADAGEEKNFW